MCTSAIVRVEGIKFCELYCHYDGYPSNMIPFLEKFNKGFTEKRGDDPEYKIAQLIRHTAVDGRIDLDDVDCLGFGIVKPGECGSDYVYTLKKDGSVTYRKCD